MHVLLLYIISRQMDALMGREVKKRGRVPVIAFAGFTGATVCEGLERTSVIKRFVYETMLRLSL